jgi:hypothetical protein
LKKKKILRRESMCAGEVQANSLNFGYIPKAQTYNIEEENSSEGDSWEDDYSEDGLKAVEIVYHTCPFINQLVKVAQKRDVEMALDQR